MGHGGKMTCEKCGKNITMEGVQLCLHCDPDVEAIIELRAERQTPDLCDKCFKEHQREHLNQAAVTPCPTTSSAPPGHCGCPC
jgi:hypothetical protein